MSQKNEIEYRFEIFNSTHQDMKINQLFFMTFLSIMNFYHDFSSNSLHVFSSWFSIKWSSCFSIIALYHDFLSWLFIKWSSCFSIIVLYQSFLSKLSIKWSSCFSSWLSIKKIMQKDNAKAKIKEKSEKISIFSSLDVIFNCLMSRVESASSDSTRNQYQVESWCLTWVIESSRDVWLK